MDGSFLNDVVGCWSLIDGCSHSRLSWNDIVVILIFLWNDLLVVALVLFLFPSFGIFRLYREATNQSTMKV